MIVMTKFYIFVDILSNGCLGALEKINYMNDGLVISKSWKVKS